MRRILVHEEPMAEERKPKIDLKARLGRNPGGAAPMAAPVPAPGRNPTSVVPPPNVGGSVPPPAAAGWGGGVGVPAPPFGKQATDPFGAPVAVVPALRPSHAPAGQTLKIELDEATVRAAARGGKKAAILGGITLMMGLGLGYAWGGQRASDRQAQIAVDGAAEMVKDIEGSQAKIKELSEKIVAAIKSLKDKKFPESFASELGGISIPFGADKLASRNIGRFDPRTLQLVFSYTNDVESLNDRKDALKNLFSAQKPAVLTALGAASNPKVQWSVFIQKGGKGPVGFLAPIPDGFAAKDNWPAKLKILNGRDPVDAERYNTGEVTSTDKKYVAVPLDPDNVSNSFPNDILSRITSELVKTDAILAGTPATVPGEDDSPGILKKGDQLLTALRKIGHK
jgi:hypothetical protein